MLERGMARCRGSKRCMIIAFWSAAQELPRVHSAGPCKLAIKTEKRTDGRYSCARARAELVHLPLLAVGKELVEHERVHAAALRPQHHEHNNLELVQTDDLVRQRHGALDDQLTQAWCQDSRAFEESEKAPAFRRQFCRLLPVVAAKRGAEV